MQRVANLISTERITRQEFDKHSKASFSTISKRFGGWKNALERAGLENRWSRKALKQAGIGTQKLTAQRFTDDELIAELHRVAAMFEGQPLTTETFNLYGRVCAITIARRLGSWNKAMKQAGLEVPNKGKRYTDDEYRENLLQVWTHYGRQPIYGEMNKPPSTIKATAYEKKWGKWRSALSAFVKYANSDSNLSTTASVGEQPVPEVISPHITKPKEIIKEKRSLSIGLRFKILHRDNFRCVLCGASPATHLGCELHVDHILPWSKGGRTVEENLRSLCASCNIGRGNRYTE